MKRVLLECIVGVWMLLVPGVAHAQGGLDAVIGSEQTISMDLQDANLKDVLKIFSIQSGLNFIASEAVENKKVTLYLDKVPIKDAMDKLFAANKLIYQFDEQANMFIVQGKDTDLEMITKIFRLKNRSVTTSNIEKQRENLFSQSDIPGQTGGDMKVAETSDIKEMVKQVLSKNGKVSEDNRTNSLIVTDIAQNFPVIRQLIASLDVPQAQVMLDVEMLDVSKDKVDKLGFKFGQSPFNFNWSSATKLNSFPFHETLKNILGEPAAGVGESSDDNYRGYTNWGSYSVLMDFLKSQTDTKFLARPRILTMNNETATISITKDIVVSKKTTTDDETEETETEYERATSLSLTPEGIGIFLRVTPTINTETGEIIMVVNPKTSSATQSAYVTEEIALDPEVRSTKSIVKVKDGETIVIGGLIHQDKEMTSTKLPIFSNIPIMGMLFRHKSVPKAMERELLVFITPHIVRDAGAAAAPKPLAPAVVAPQAKADKVTLFTRHEAVSSALNNLE